VARCVGSEGDDTIRKARVGASDGGQGRGIASAAMSRGRRDDDGVETDDSEAKGLIDDDRCGWGAALDGERWCGRRR
jgi:hypothetical protein